MPKKYRVVSQSSPVKGKTPQDVIQGLGRLGMKPEQAGALLQKNIVIKKDLDNPKALEYLEKFTEAGLLVKVEAYEVAAPVVEKVESPADAVFAQLEEAFSQPIKPTALTQAYRKSFAVALATSLVAPLLYAGLIALVTFGLIWYFVSGHGVLFGDMEWHGKFMLTMWALSWVVPAVAGSVLILFLLYPLWPRGRAPKPLILDRKKNARLYQLVDRMTKSMGVPAPQFIEIIPDVNAAAAPVSGMGSLAKGELRLVIGMALVLGSNVQQFMGVLAHEFGHFSQRSSMLAYGWINRVNHWLWQCGFGQDVWTERLENWKAHYENEIVQVSLFVTGWLLALVRVLFQNLFRLSVRLTHPMSQQMEFDADLYEARVVGSAQFRDDTLALRRMGHAWSMAQNLCFQSLHEKDKLMRNMPAAALEISKGFSPILLKQIEDSLQVEETRYWDTHPADLERIAYAEKSGEKGILQCDQPAAILFAEVEKLCENATMNEYFRLGISGAREFVVDNAELLQALNKPVVKAVAQAKGQGAPAKEEPKSVVNENGMIEWTGATRTAKRNDDDD